MKYLVKVKRQKSFDEKPYIEEYEIDVEGHVSVATVLKELNDNNNANISWEAGCMNRKCGACAMVINGRPSLACSTFVNELKGNEIVIEPLSKFPVVKDLIVDKTVIFDRLKNLEIFLEKDASNNNDTRDLRYMSSKCMMCGCCLEVCPNFNVNSEFTGALGAVNAYRIINQEEKSHYMHDKYKKSFYKECAKSLSCQNICPAGIEVDELTARTNAALIWNK